ncbi:reticulocalbin 3 [Phyllostomus discolor]|uniref:Reticulocalbin-3 n=1 Tax=Phyllostomus discolor TaxID=89673 RepID=A0A833YRI3_9CHIR|nr:reticulocalbin 3 [Phyllostomus discolor]
MTWQPSLLLLLLLLRQGVQGKPSPEAGPHGSGRVHQQAPLSEAPHDDAHGNFQYDHEAFLGREVAKEFDQLSPEESQARLGRIVDRMDRAGDGDGWVSLAELRSWIAHTQQRHIQDSVSAAWHTYDTDRDGRVGWEELRNATYGYYAPGEEFHDVEDAETYKKMLARDERRFRAADQDGDLRATREELTAFLHPEEFPHMRDVVVAVSEGLPSTAHPGSSGYPIVQHLPQETQAASTSQWRETLEDLDKNKDGYIQVEEYIADLYSAEPGEEEPAWVQTERDQFRDFRDLNKDGHLDGREVGHWVLPPAQDQPLVEANHLLHESDTDKDGRLSKAEILGNWNMFVGSQATNYALQDVDTAWAVPLPLGSLGPTWSSSLCETPQSPLGPPPSPTQGLSQA